MKLLGLDTETGGIESPDVSLLTASFVIFNESLKPLDKFNLAVKPNPVNGRTNYVVQSEALAVNKINLIEHDKVAITYKEGGTALYNWLQDKKNKYGKLTPFGNLVQGDISKLTRTLISLGAWGGFVDNRVIELTSIGKNLQLMGKIHQKQSLSIGALADFFEIKVDKALLHTAEYDVMIGAEILREYNKLLCSTKGTS